MKTKVSILINSMGGGGAERVVSIILEHLSSTYDLTLVLLNEDSSYSIPFNLKVHYLGNPKSKESSISKLIKLPMLALEYSKFCKQNNIQLSFSLLTRSNFINVLSKVCFQSKSKIVINERGTPSLYYGDNSLQSQLNKFLMRRLYHRADLVISNAKANGEDLVQHFNIKNNIKTIYNPIDLIKVQEQAKEDVEFNDKKFTFITVGRLNEGKNHKLMIEAFSRLDNENLQLLILGDGELKQSLEDIVKAHALETKIHFKGFDVNPYKYLSKADAFVFTSNFEGFPNVLIEAMACGLPIISTDCISGPKEILCDELLNGSSTRMKLGGYGILTPVNNLEELIRAMQTIIDDQTLREDYSKLSLKRVKDFEKDNYLKKVKETIDELV